MKRNRSVLYLCSSFTFVALSLATLFCTAGSAEPETKMIAPGTVAETTRADRAEADSISDRAKGRQGWAWADPNAANQEDPIIISGEARRPLIFFRKMANQRWKIGGLFAYLFIVSAILKIFLPRLTWLATERCKGNYFSSLSAAFIYSTALTTLVRFSFANEALNAMGVFTFGLLQLSFALGSCIGVNLFAQNLYGFFASKKTPTSTTARVITYGVCLLVVGIVMTVISMVPNLGLLPRIGNRMVMLVAALGLGGLVNLAAGNQKSET